MEIQHITAPVPIYVILSVHHSLSPLKYHSDRRDTTYYALCYRGWLSGKSKVSRSRHRTPDRPRRGDEPKTGDSYGFILFLVQRCDTLRRYSWEALLALELPRSRPLRSERHHITALFLIYVILSVHCSLSTPTDHSRGDGKFLSL